MSEREREMADNTKSWETRFRKARALLQGGKTEEAIEVMESLVEEKQDERVARTLLAMAYSRCDRWDDAEKMYRSLIADNPKEILLRVRLATLLMQLQRDNEAKALLEEVASSEPDSKELHSTLGVIYMRLGLYSDARDAFVVIGDDALMAALKAKMDEEGATFNEPVLDSEPDLEPETSPLDFLEESSFGKDTQGDVVAINDVSVEQPFSIGDFLPVDDQYAPSLPNMNAMWSENAEGSESVEGALPVVVLPPSENKAESGEFSQSQVVIREDVPFVMTPTSLGSPDDATNQIPLGLSRGENAAPLWVDFVQLFGDAQREFLLLNDGRLLIQVREQAYCRMRDLAMLIGDPAMEVEHKRFQGKSVGQVFGPKSNPIIRLEGECQLLVQAQEEGSRSSVLLVGGQVAYFREGTVLAFSSTIDWENGRVPSGLNGVEDLALDQFWGQGELILESSGPIWGIPARPGQAVRVEYERLVGWVGELVPQIVPGDEVASSVQAPAFVEFEGEGGVLISS